MYNKILLRNIGYEEDNILLNNLDILLYILYDEIIIFLNSIIICCQNPEGNSRQQIEESSVYDYAFPSNLFFFEKGNIFMAKMFNNRCNKIRYN